MSFFNRLNLRQNWPLYVAGAACILSVAFLLIVRLINQTIPQYPDYNMQPVIYPLLTFNSGFLFLLIPLALLVTLFILGIGLLGRRLALVQFLLALLLNSAVCYFCVGTAFTNTSFVHKQDLWFNNHLYRLAETKESDWDYTETKFIVFECNQDGISCAATYISDGYYDAFNDGFSDTELRADPLTNTIYLQMREITLYVKDIESGSSPVSINLPMASTITRDNSHNIIQLVSLLRGETNQLTWSPAGNLLAVGGSFSLASETNPTGVWLYDIDHLQIPPRLLPVDYENHHRNSVESIAFSPDGKLIAVGSNNYSLRLLDVQTSREIAILSNDQEIVSAIDFSPDGQWIATGDVYHNNIRLWNLNTQSLDSVLYDDSLIGLSLDFSSDGKLLASIGSEVHLWDTETREMSSSIPLTDQEYVYSVAFSPDSRFLAYGGATNMLRLWDIETNANVLAYNFSDESRLRVSGIAFSPDGTLLATGDSDGIVRIRDTQTGEELIALEGHYGDANSVAFNADGTLLASTGLDGTVRLWGVPSP